MLSNVLARLNNPRKGNRSPSGAVDTSSELTNTVLSIVREVGEMLKNVPYVKSLSGVILQIIRVRDEVKANKKRCREIIDKVLRMSKSIYEKLAEVAQSDQRDKLSKLEGHLNEHESALTAVFTALEKHRFRSLFSKIVNRGLDELNEHDRRLDQLNTQLILDIIFRITMEQAASTPAVGQTTTSDVLDHTLPPKPHLLVERETHLQSALDILLGADSSRIAILGGGGFGKTTLARTILYDPRIKERYKSRYFLSCEGMTNDDTLLLGFGAMLRITAPPPEILASARRMLQTSTTILCLDNFETPWEPSATRTKVEDLLASIADIPNLSLIITMRGTQRPSKVVWSQPLLSPLSTLSSDGACLVLQGICPNHTVDEFTEKLLDGIEGIPLAITLVANLLRDGETSRALWNRWSKEHTTIVENGGDDRESNLDASIALSVNSPRMKRDPGALTLLAALSLLPDGFPLAEIDGLEEYLGLTSIHKLLQTLRTVALIKSEEPYPSSRIQMLSPIRLFCSQFLSSQISQVIGEVVNYYINVMFGAGTDRTNSEIYARIVSEIPNIHSIFQRGFKSGYLQEITRLLDATVILTHWSTYIGYLVHETVKIALEQLTNLPISHAKWLFGLGELYYIEGNYSEAKACFTKASNLFEQENNPVKQAHALHRLGDVLQSWQQLDAAEHAFEASLALHTQVDDKQGQANVGYSIGKLYMKKDQYPEAEESFTSALDAYKQTQDLLGQSNAANELSRLHINLGNLTKAEEFATKALNTAKQANYATGEGNAHRELGAIYLLTDRVEEAKQALEKTLAIHKQQNFVINQLNTVHHLGEAYIQLDQLSAAEALLTKYANFDPDVIHTPIILTTLGWLYICSDQLDKAEHHLDRALKLFQKFENKPWQADVLSHIGAVYLRSNRLDDAERVLKSIPDLGEWGDVEIRRLWVLGDLYIIKGQLDDAETSLNSSMARCQNHEESYSYQQGNILRSMGTLHVKCGRIDQAIEKFKEAREFHQKAQWVSEQATDLKRLGEAYEMLGRPEEAETAFKEAEALMETVREARVLSEP